MTSPQTTVLSDLEVAAAIDRALETVAGNIDIFGDLYPDDTTRDGVYPLRSRPGFPAGANVGWTTGFWPGMLWLGHEYSGDGRLAAAAGRHVESFSRRLAERIDIATHDLGFLYTLSCVVAARRGDDGRARRAGLEAADRLMDRYLAPPGIIQAWGSLEDPAQRGRTIIDSLMNTPLLHWASQETGRSTYAEAAERHVESLQDHIVRPDGSTFHTFSWNAETGAPERGGTEQGNADESCWARGQAWGIYGFAINHRLTGRPSFLAAARRCAEYFVAHLDPELVPYWDLAFHDGSGAPKDSSSAAIAAAGLLEIDALDPDPQYHDLAHRILASLARTYAPTPEDGSNALLLHGVYDAPKGIGVDEGTLWGDYFYLESLLRIANPNRESFW